VVIEMPYQWVEHDLGDYTDEDLVEELEHRHYNFKRLIQDEIKEDIDAALFELADCKRYNPEKFDAMFSQFVWDTIGKSI
jgi:hypothetical protein